MNCHALRRFRTRVLTRARIVVACSAAVAAVAACGTQDQRRAQPDQKAADSAVETSAPASGVRTANLASGDDLDENSAAAVSIARSGIVFTVNDSGNEPELFAFDTTGADRGRWRIVGAINRDWEAVAVGRCAPAREGWCVFIGDVGDNALRRPLVTIYRVPEPVPLAAGERGELRADVLVARYPDGAHNVEAMVVAPDGALQLVTKELRRSSGRAPATTRVYQLPASAWGGATPADAVLVDSLPIPADAVARSAVTDEALSPDGTLLVVRTPVRIFTFRLDSSTAQRLPDVAPAICDLSPLEEKQGEGVGILRVDSATVRLALTSEGRREPLRLVSCPIPPR